MSECKAMVWGEVGVGKSALLIQFINNHFIEEYDPTVEDSFRKRLSVDDVTLVYEILDAGIAEEATRELSLRESEGFLLTFSLTSKSSFEALDGYMNKLTHIKDNPNVPVVLVGNKCDLSGDRAVSKEEAESLAKTFGCPYFETSAKNRINVDEAFHQLVREIRSSKRQSPPKK